MSPSAHTVPIVPERARAGAVRAGGRVSVLGADIETVVTGLETFGKPMESAEAGDKRRVAAARGGARPGAPRPCGGRSRQRQSEPRRFIAQVYVLSAGEGGRTTPVTTGYRPQFYIRTADVVGGVDLGGTDVARPSDTVTMTIELGRDVPLESGLGFAIREGGRAVGAGTVTGLL